MNTALPLVRLDEYCATIGQFSPHTQPRQDGLGEGRSDGETVDEVVDPVPKDDHPGHSGDAAGRPHPLHRVHRGPGRGVRPVLATENIWWIAKNILTTQF